jgi:hypothetical protein
MPPSFWRALVDHAHVHEQERIVGVLGLLEAVELRGRRVQGGEILVLGRRRLDLRRLGAVALMVPVVAGSVQAPSIAVAANSRVCRLIVASCGEGDLDRSRNMRRGD